MVTCALDKNISGEILGWKIPAWQSLLLHRVLPSCGGLIIYLIVICFDFALIYEHFANGEKGIGALCVTLIVLPSIIALVFTLASPPSSLETELSGFTVTLQKNDIKWILLQFAKAIFFPFAAIGRYCFQIFWWVEAVCASRAQDDERIREAISIIRDPSPMELYLFLQAFIHSAPFAIVNILDLMARYSGLTYDNISVQAISIIAATLRMASTATMYRRFEREKLCGRKYPWQKLSTDDTKNLNNENNSKNDKEVEENIYEPILKRESSVSEKTDESSKIKTNSDLMQFSPRNTITSSVFYDDLSESDLSSDYMPPLSPPKKRKWSSVQDSDEEYVRPISIIDRVAPRRRDTEYTIEKVNITPPPAIPAPRPGSIAVWAEKLVENAESIPTWLSAPPRRKYCDEVVQDEPDLPRRVPRSYMRGLEPQDMTAALVHYLGWYAFFVARLLSIACFINFSIFIATIILFSHYQIMLLFLIVPQASTVKRGFYVFLAFIYIFCLMEFKIRFRHVRVWHVFWIIVCTIETLVFTSVWVSVDNTIDEWWRAFIVKVILGGMTLGYMCFLVYFVLLKPRETIVYIKPKQTPSQ
ncbi:hypothetical protein K1T71_002427 [Dendrolimus kikuchii]|uniref:Uncharacterized protein n=1 Tax=Dendrolimus kikuchii TaxID=765133 RepID=A0ACC1DD04_9NEOP|nr:hypothetical protein K1T71_002427 [Dendrolimus kikuchii]